MPWEACGRGATWWDMDFSSVAQNAVLGTDCTGGKMEAQGPGEQPLQSSALWVTAAPTRVVAERLNVTHILKVESTRFTDELSCVCERQKNQ